MPLLFNDDGVDMLSSRADDKKRAQTLHNQLTIARTLMLSTMHATSTAQLVQALSSEPRLHSHDDGHFLSKGYLNSTNGSKARDICDDGDKDTSVLLRITLLPQYLILCKRCINIITLYSCAGPRSAPRCSRRHTTCLYKYTKCQMYSMISPIKPAL